MINDLRSALNLLAAQGELEVVSEPTDQYLEVARRFHPFSGVPDQRLQVLRFFSRGCGRQIAH